MQSILMNINNLLRPIKRISSLFLSPLSMDSSFIVGFIQTCSSLMRLVIISISVRPSVFHVLGLEVYIPFHGNLSLSPPPLSF